MTISNIQKLIDFLSTAKAIYADIALSVASQTDLREFLTDFAGFTEVEADAFIERYEIAVPFETTENGFQAIIFRDGNLGSESNFCDR